MPPRRSIGSSGRIAAPTARAAAARRRRGPARAGRRLRPRAQPLAHGARVSSSHALRERPAAGALHCREPLLELAPASRPRAASDSTLPARRPSPRRSTRLALLEQREPLRVEPPRRRRIEHASPRRAVVSARSTTRSPRAATTGASRRSCASGSPTRATRAGDPRRSVVDRDAAHRPRSRLELLERDVEPVRDGNAPGATSASPR